MQITKAMELVASSKLRKAKEEAQAMKAEYEKNMQEAKNRANDIEMCIRDRYWWYNHIHDIKITKKYWIDEKIFDKII